MNLGAWRLRDYSTWNYYNSDENRHSEWEHINTYLERTVIPLKGRLTVGDSYTSSEIFDSLLQRRPHGGEVKETDGSISRYSVPYSAVPLLQREGRVK